MPTHEKHTELLLGGVVDDLLAIDVQVALPSDPKTKLPLPVRDIANVALTMPDSSGMNCVFNCSTSARV
jgi:hypothetical protein